MIPEAWENHTQMIGAFYEYPRGHDGARDGTGLDRVHRRPPDRRTLDRNGLRPSRYMLPKTTS